MRFPLASNSPGFFWQGILILLPAVVLAAAGLYAIRQDRLLVAQEAAEEARKLASDLGRQALPRALALPLPSAEMGSSSLALVTPASAVKPGSH
jgi:hypothetical protein